VQNRKNRLLEISEVSYNIEKVCKPRQVRQKDPAFERNETGKL
jgi:hypothetical protein